LQGNIELPDLSGEEYKTKFILCMMYGKKMGKKVRTTLVLSEIVLKRLKERVIYLS